MVSQNLNIADNSVGFIHGSLIFFREIDYAAALHWYTKLLEKCEENDAEGGYDSVTTRVAPKYQVLASIAEIYLRGGKGVTSDPNKAGRYTFNCQKYGSVYYCLF